MELHWANSEQFQLFLEKQYEHRKYKQIIYNIKQKNPTTIQVFPFESLCTLG